MSVIVTPTKAECKPNPKAKPATKTTEKKTK